MNYSLEEKTVEELLDLLPPKLQIRSYNIDHYTRKLVLLDPMDFNFWIRKVPSENTGELPKVFKEGAWEVSYKSATTVYPLRRYGRIGLIDIKDLSDLPEDDYWTLSGGVLDSNLKRAILILIDWLERNNICQV